MHNPGSSPDHMTPAHRHRAMNLDRDYLSQGSKRHRTYRDLDHRASVCTRICIRAPIMEQTQHYLDHPIKVLTCLCIGPKDEKKSCCLLEETIHESFLSLFSISLLYVLPDSNHLPSNRHFSLPENPPNVVSCVRGGGVQSAGSWQLVGGWFILVVPWVRNSGRQIDTRYDSSFLPCV